MDIARIKKYEGLARKARIDIIGLIHKAQTSHVASNLSCIDFVTVLYENLEQKDEWVWSCGWKAATIYYFLNKQGKITDEQLATFPKSPFFGLAETTVPGVHVSGGSMGHGLPVSVGMALAKNKMKEDGRIFCIMSDGEMQEGTTWEAAQIASHNKLDNLVVIIDFNKWCAMGQTSDVCNLEPFEKRWEGFGFKALRIDGHSYEQIESALGVRETDKPLVIICDTIKGKGVKDFENSLLYHYKYVDDNDYAKALAELNA